MESYGLLSMILTVAHMTPSSLLWDLASDVAGAGRAGSAGLRGMGGAASGANGCERKLQLRMPLHLVALHRTCSVAMGH